jgi:tRNA-dihydrouridine synthase 2
MLDSEQDILSVKKLRKRKKPGLLVVPHCRITVMTEQNGDFPSCEPLKELTPRAAMTVEEKAWALYRGEGLAPMVRASAIPLRTLALRYGADFCYTEELIDRSLSSTVRVVNDDLGTIDYIKMDPHGHTKNGSKRNLSQGNDSALILRLDKQREQNRLICQIGTGDPELAVQAAIHVHQDVDAIDINMGCPKKFSVGGGMGSALLNDPDRACRIIRSISNKLSASSNNQKHGPIPVSAKIRLLRDTQATLDFVSALVNAGANAIAIHGRHVGDPDVQSASWEELSTVISMASQKFPHVPFLINGDFYTRHEFTSFMHQTGAAGVLLARPALYNMSLFRKPPPSSDSKLFDESPIIYDSRTPAPKTVLHGYNSPLLLDKTVVIQDYLREAIRYDGHYKNIKYVICEMMNSRRAPHVRVPYLHQTFPGGQTIGLTCARYSLSDLCLLWNVDYQVERKNHPQEQTLLPGEHKYLESYILQPHHETGIGTIEEGAVKSPLISSTRVHNE